MTAITVLRFAGTLSFYGGKGGTTVYKNHEGYADPTAGTALAHIIYEQRQGKRKASQRQIISEHTRKKTQRNSAEGRMGTDDFPHHKRQESAL